LIIVLAVPFTKENESTKHWVELSQRIMKNENEKIDDDD